MGLMSGKVTAILGIAGAATLGIYWKFRHARRRHTSTLEHERSVSAGNPGRIDIDDDAAAEIIKRARPELERARLLYGY